MSTTEGTIVERLTAQRTMLVDVVRQIDTAISAFGGVTTNGNGATPKAEKRGSWWSQKTPAQRARITRKILAAKRARRLEREAQTVSGGL